MIINLKNFWAGVLFIGIGLYFALEAWLNLRVGSALNMGPGYFPIILGGILASLGLAIGLGSLGKVPEPLGAVPWRGLALVIGAILFFAFTVRGLGFAPALAGASLMAALSSGKMSLRGAVLLALAISAFGVLVFVVALRLPYPIVGRWIIG